MERKGRKTIYKKFIAVLCIVALLQSYFPVFAQIAIAINEEPFVEETSSTMLNDEVINQEETPEEETEEIPEEQNEAGLFINPGDKELDPILGGEDETVDEEFVEEDKEQTVEENEQVEEDVQVETSGEEENTETTDENNVQQEQQEEVVEEQVEPEEPYVEPEVSVEVGSENSSIYKGYLYANATSDLRYATNYNTIDKVTIVGGKNITTLTIQDEPDKMQFLTGEKINLINKMYYRQTRILVEEFNNIFGQDGYITILTPEGEIIGYINSQTEVVNGEYLWTYPMQLDSVQFEFTNIIEDGTISIKNDKSIKESTDFSRNQISLFSTINTITQVGLYVGEEVRNSSAEGNINLEETESRMTIDTDTNTLSVEGKNEVAINVTLKTDEERYDLFENPSIELEFPSAIEDVEVTGMTLLYKNGLSIDNWDVSTNSIGKKVLKINLEGSQLEYTPGAVQEGTTVVAYTNLDVNRLTADTSENLRMTYTNKDTIRKTYALEGKDSEDISFDFVGRQELVRAMKITGADESATSYDETTEKIQIKANEEQTVTINGAIVNNYEAVLNDVVIVGRIPFVGNKDGNGNDLGTNFDTLLQNAISTSGVIADVYYSEDGLAVANSDSWGQDVQDFSNIKSYKIVVREKTLAKGEKLSFEYNLTVPQEVGHNGLAYSNYVVYYKIDTQNYANQCSCGMWTETKEIDLEDIKEEERQDLAVLTIGTQVSQGGRVLGENDLVYERQILKYTVVVRNTSDQTANNVLIRANAENANLYTWDYIVSEDYWGDSNYISKQLREWTKEEKEFEEWTTEKLEPGESKTFEYQVIVDENASSVQGNISVIAENVEKGNIQTINLNVEEAEVEVRCGYAGTEDVENQDATTNSEFKIYSYIKNITDKDLENVELTFVLPEELEFKETYFVFGADGLEKKIEKVGNQTLVTFTIPKLKVGDEREIFISTLAKKFDVNILSKIITVYSIVKTENGKYTSNDYKKKVNQIYTEVDYNWQANCDKEILENDDEITYKLSITNKGNLDTYELRLEFNIDSGLEIENAEIKNGENTINTDTIGSKIIGKVSIKANETVDLIIKGKVQEKYFKLNQSSIEEKVSVKGGNIDDFETDIISFKIDNKYVSSTTNQGEKRVELNQDEINKIKEDFKNDTNDTNDTNDNQNLNDKEEQKNDKENVKNETNRQEDTNSINNGINTNTVNTNTAPTRRTTNVDTNKTNNNTINNQNKEDIQTTSNETTNTKNNEQINNTNTDIPKYFISGLAWIDSNQDGIRQNEEKLKSAVVVSLYKSNSNGGLDTSSKIVTTATNENGQYSFSGVEEGNYIVVFDYNSSKYKVTKYQVKTAKSNENSDVISKKITINGETELLGVTDVLEVKNSSLVNIDIGLVDKTNFDLSLEKTISTVIVKNGEISKTYKYNKGLNEKIDIRAKDFKSTVLDITYNFKVQNEGEVAGYVNKIVDYLPEDGVEVILNSSPDWYMGSDNGLYYTGLVDKAIEPGETKEFSLVVRKSLEKGEALKLVNSAEIVEYTNAEGLFDRDSIENNKMKSEDDFGTTTLTISVSTGNTIPYIVSIIMIIIIISTMTMMGIKFKNSKKMIR